MTVEAVNDLLETEIMQWSAGLTGETGGLGLGCDDSRWLNLGIHSVDPSGSSSRMQLARLGTSGASSKVCAHAGGGLAVEFLACQGAEPDIHHGHQHFMSIRNGRKPTAEDLLKQCSNERGVALANRALDAVVKRQ